MTSKTLQHAPIKFITIFHIKISYFKSSVGKFMIFRCFWNGEGLESEYTHVTELSEEDFLFVKELDGDYSYDEYEYSLFDE